MARPKDPLVRIAPHHRLLLVAALSETDPARKAWREWCGTVVFEDVDGPAVRLLPILAQRSDVVDTKDPRRGRMMGLSRRSWVANERLVAASVPARSALIAASLPVLHVEAVPLAMAFGESSKRPLYDIDFCLPRRSMRSAIRVLSEMGWKSEPSGLRARWQHRPRHFVSGDARLRLINDVPWPGADPSAWETSTIIESGERLLSVHDALVHAAVRSVQPWQQPSAYWVADVVRLSTALGYDRVSDALADECVIERAAAHNSSEVVHAALTAADQILGPTSIR